MPASAPLPPPPRDRRVVRGVFLIALALRLIYLLQLHGSGLWDYLRLDPLYYHDWAVRIAGGDVVGEGTYEMTPLYAWWAGAIFGIAGYSPALLRVLQAFIGAGTCALIAWLGLRIFGRAEAWVAGLALAAYGPLLFHESQIMKTILTVSLSTATAVLLYVSEGRRVRLLAGAGAMLGLTALAQENMNITIPVILAWIFVRAPSGKRIAGAGALLAGFIIVVSPATIHNYAVSGELVLITSGGGEVFYTGNNEHASGRYGPPHFVRPDPFFEHEDFRAEAARRLGRPVTRVESDAFWWREGMRFIVRHPGAWCALLGDKLAVYFTDFERPDNYSYDNFREFIPMLRLPLLRFGWVAPLGLIGVVLTLRRRADLFPLYVTMGAFLASALIFFTQARYRMPMIPLMALFAAHAAVRLTRAAAGKRWRFLAISMPALLMLSLLVNRDPGNSHLFEAQNHGILGEMHLHAGHNDDAVREFRLAISMLSDYAGDSAGDQHLRVLASSHYGVVLARDAGSGVTEEEALDHLRNAGRSPDADLRHDALDALGRMLMARGDAAGAADAWSSAAAARPGSLALRLRLAEALHRSNRPDASLSVAAAVLADFPDADPRALASAHFGQALIYLDARPDARLAAHHLAEVLRLNPDHPRAGWIRQRLTALDRTP